MLWHARTMMVLAPSRWSLGPLAACLAAAAFTGCADSGEVKDESGSGGSIAGSTGGSGSGDQPGAGGAGATSASGSVTGSGSASSGGGSPGEGGATGGGGSPGDGGGGAGGAANTCPPATPLTGGMEYCSNSRGNAGNGYGYELWAEGGGSGCMTVHGVGATFSAEWNNVEDFLARVGLDFNQTRKHAQIGTFSADFAHTKTEEGGGLTYIGIYGWTVNPLREFYILDDWGSAKPGGFSSDGTPRDEVGTLTADGETYDVWKKTRVNKPAITGPSETFDQYFSIRRTARTCGTISVSEHFTKWEGLGLSLGNLHEVKLLIEAQSNSGTIKFTTANVVVR
ncbi:glycoside hydrolase family 11 protein [Sorangium sp. So ce119]|uniref:glycoside hydrolase family 11 protein n=1 Tax=Sorangium sp. So ce119 TaxID=3133279 RepID=UPI003F60FCCC